MKISLRDLYVNIAGSTRVNISAGTKTEAVMAETGCEAFSLTWTAAVLVTTEITNLLAYRYDWNLLTEFWCSFVLLDQRDQTGSHCRRLLFWPVKLLYNNFSKVQRIMHVKLFLLLNSFFETFTVVLTLQLRLRLHDLVFSLMTIPHLRISKTFCDSLDYFFFFSVIITRAYVAARVVICKPFYFLRI